LFKCSFSLLKSCLEFLLLNFKAAALLVKLVDRAASISKLVKEILDFISKIFVLALDNIELLNSLIPCSSEPEEFTVVVAALLLAGFKLGSKIINLGFPFSNNLKGIIFKVRESYSVSS
jgi:hypothetical protein